MSNERFIDTVPEWSVQDIERIIRDIDRIVPKYSEVYDEVINIAKANLVGQSEIAFFAKSGNIILKVDSADPKFNSKAAKEHYRRSNYEIPVESDSIEFIDNVLIDRYHIAFDGYKHNTTLHDDYFYINNCYKIKTEQLKYMNCLSSPISDKLGISICEKELDIMSNFYQHSDEIIQFFKGDALKSIYNIIYIY